MRSLNFLLSFSRSGSTLLMSHLGTHEDIETDVGEPNFLYRLVSDPHIQYENYRKMYRMKPGEVTQIYNEGVRAMVKEYYDRLCDRTGRTTVLLKHPWLTEHGARMAAIFPDAKFLYLVRHPYDVIASTYHFTQINKVARKMFGKDDLDNIMACYERAYAGMHSIEMRKLNPMLINYEDYVGAHSSIVLKCILKFLGVDYSDDVTEFIMQKAYNNNSHGVGSYIAQSQVFKPKDKWNKVLSKAQRVIVRRRLKPLMQSLGYENK